MRLSETKTAQLVENELGNVLVLLDEVSGDEIVLSPAEVHHLATSIAHFGAHL